MRMSKKVKIARYLLSLLTASLLPDYSYAEMCGKLRVSLNHTTCHVIPRSTRKFVSILSDIMETPLSQCNQNFVLNIPFFRLILRVCKVKHPAQI